MGQFEEVWQGLRHRNMSICHAFPKAAFSRRSTSRGRTETAQQPMWLILVTIGLRALAQLLWVFRHSQWQIKLILIYSSPPGPLLWRSVTLCFTLTAPSSPQLSSPSHHLQGARREVVTSSFSFPSSGIVMTQNLCSFLRPSLDFQKPTLDVKDYFLCLYFFIPTIIILLC